VRNDECLVEFTVFSEYNNSVLYQRPKKKRM
jgi:hypothetical protein